MSRILRIAALQKRVGSHIAPAVFERLHEAGVDIVCLPEYFFIPDAVRNQVETADHRQRILTQLEAYSRIFAGVVVGGSLVEKAGASYYNACHVFDCGRHVGYYRKRHLTGREKAVGISPGERPAVFEIRGFRLGILICADVLVRDHFEELAKLRPGVIAVPTVSPHLENDSIAEKYLRDQEYFVRGARMAGSYLIKACGVGNLMGSRLQGRSLLCSPQKVLARVPPSKEMLEATLMDEVDLDAVPSLEEVKSLAAIPQYTLPPGLRRA